MDNIQNNEDPLYNSNQRFNNESNQQENDYEAMLIADRTEFNSF